MAGCGEDGGTSATSSSESPSSSAASSTSESSESSSSVYVPSASVTNITFASGIPSVFEVGDVIDLNDYVTIAPSTESFSLTVKEAYASVISVNGTKITMKKAGAFLVTIHSGTNDYKKAFEGTVQSDSLAALTQTLSTVGKNYTVSGFGDSATTKFTFHSEKYFASPANNGYYSGVLLASDAHTYSFVLGSDLTTLEVKAGYQGALANYYLGEAFPLTGANFADEFDANGDSTGYLVDKTADDIANIGLYAIGDDYGTALGADSLKAKATNNGVSFWFFSGTTQEMAFSLSAIGTTTVQSLESYVSGSAVPDKLAHSELTQEFADLASAKSYSERATINWVNAETGEEAAKTSSMTKFMAERDYSASINATEYYSIDNLTGGVIGLLYSGAGTEYSVTNYDDLGAVTTATTNTALTTAINVWDSTRPFSTAMFTDTIVNSANYVSRSVNGTVTSLDFNGYGEDEAETMLRVINLVPQIGSSLASYFASLGDAKTNWYDYFLGASAVVDSSTKALTLTADLNWDGTIVLRTKIVISGVGTDVVPAFD